MIVTFIWKNNFHILACSVLVYRIPVVVNIKGYDIHFLIRTVCQIVMFLLIAILFKKKSF